MQQACTFVPVPQQTAMAQCNALPMCCLLTYVLCTDFILQGPLLSSCGLDAVALDTAEWVTTGKQLAKQLHFDHDHLDDVQK